MAVDPEATLGHDALERKSEGRMHPGSLYDTGI